MHRSRLLPWSGRSVGRAFRRRKNPPLGTWSRLVRLEQAWSGLRSESQLHRQASHQFSGAEHHQHQKGYPFGEIHGCYVCACSYGFRQAGGVVKERGARQSRSTTIRSKNVPLFSCVSSVRAGYCAQISLLAFSSPTYTSSRNTSSSLAGNRPGHQAALPAKGLEIVAFQRFLEHGGASFP